MPDSWAMVDFTVPEATADIVADFLWSMGVQAVEEREGEPGRPVLRTSLGEDPLEHIAHVCARFEGVTGRVIHLDKDLSETWRRHATATYIDERIAIVPAWVTPPQNATSVLIEPGDTFGLGNHPTTVLALRMALRITRPSDLILDFGCGSGVLAIGVSKIGGNECDVFDIAESSRRFVADNCVLNGITNVHWNDQFESRVYDVVLANILAPVLRSEAPRIIAATRRPTGRVILSGIRDDQVARVEESYEGFTEIARENLDGWSCVALTRRTTP